MRKILPVLWIILFVFFVLSSVNYVVAVRAANHFYEDVMKFEDLSKLGFIVPYIDHYNKSIVYYTEKDYVNAENESYQALMWNHPKDEDRDCKIRINYALSIAKQYPESVVTQDNVSDIIKRLKVARNVLCENNCADMNDQSWHNDDAQTLKKELDEYIKKLEEMEYSGQDGNNNSQNNNQDGKSGQDNNDQNGQNNSNNQNQNNNDNQGNQDNQNPDNQDGQGNQNPNNQDNQGNQDQNNQDPNNQDGQGGQNRDNRNNQGDQNQNNQNQSNNNGNGDNQTNGQGQADRDPYQDKLDKLWEIQNEGSGTHENTMNKYEHYLDDDDDFYYGHNW